MQCSLAAYKLNKTAVGKDDFLSFLQYISTLLQNAPILGRISSSIDIYNIAILTGRNDWPVKRETPEEWKAMR